MRARKQELPHRVNLFFAFTSSCASIIQGAPVQGSPEESQAHVLSHKSPRSCSCALASASCVSVICFHRLPTSAVCTGSFTFTSFAKFCAAFNLFFSKCFLLFDLITEWMKFSSSFSFSGSRYVDSSWLSSSKNSSSSPNDGILIFL